MEHMTANEFLQEDGHENTSPDYDEVALICSTLWAVTDDYIVQSETGRALFYGEDLDQRVTLGNYREVSRLTGFQEYYVKEICFEYACEDADWSNLQ